MHLITARQEMSEFLANLEQDTPFHRLDPRVKMLYLFVLTIVNIFYLDSKFLLIILFSTIPFWIIARIKIRSILPQLTGIALFLLSLMIFIYSFSGSVLFSGSEYSGTEGLSIKIGPLIMNFSAANLGLVQLLRMSIPMLTSLLIFSTTDPAMFARGLDKLKIPFEISFMFLGALKLLPLILEESRNITDAQRIRGVNTRGPINRIRATGMLLFPLIINTLSKSRQLGMAVECKAFGSGKHRSFYRELKIRKGDYIMLIWIFTFATVMLYIRFVLGMGWGRMM